MPEWVAILGCFVGGVVVGELLGLVATAGLIKYREYRSEKDVKKISNMEVH